MFFSSQIMQFTILRCSKNSQLHFNERFHFDWNISVIMSTFRQRQQQNEKKKTIMPKKKPACTQHGTHKFQFTQYFTIEFVVTRWFRFHYYYYYILLLVFFFRWFNFYHIILSTYFYSFCWGKNTPGYTRGKKNAL